MNGVVIIDKPHGKTSFDVVSSVRRLFGTKKVGHTGTLDPEATGVLPVCIGKATKACELLTAQNKSYRAQLMLGMTTDTLDIEGEILTEQPVNVTREQLEDVIGQFIGEIEQTPPMYSAIKVDGKKLYELARAGKEIERKKRRITIYDIKIIEVDLKNDLVTIDVDCSKGTYIRTLCDDIGMKLGCGAFMTRLTRTKSGQFDLASSYTLPELEELKEKDELEKCLIPLDDLFFDYPKIVVNERQRDFLINGVRVRYKGLLEGVSYRVYDESGEFLSVSRCEDERLTLEKAFWS